MSFKPIDGGVASGAPYIPGSTRPDASGQGSTPASRPGEASALPALAGLAAEAKAAAQMRAVTGLMNEVGRMAGPDAGAVQAPASTPPLIIAEHPLAGQAVNDFTSPSPSFVPAALDPQPDASRDGGGGGAPSFGEGTRLLRLYSPLPADKTLLIDSMTGSAALSEQYVFHLNLLSTDASIDLQDVMAKSVSVGVQLADGSEHFINGYVRTFGFTHADGGFAFYHAEIVPWLSYLKLRINSRIFQNMNVLEVLETIYRGDYSGLAVYEFRTSRSYAKEDYIVQYQESDEHFTSRLMEKYGLFYYFEHSASGHLMVISDDSCHSSFCPPQSAHPDIQFNAGDRSHDDDSITAFAAERTVQPSKVVLNTFDFKAPSSWQCLEMPTVTQQGDVPPMEIYDGNPAFAYKNKGAGEHDARQRMEVLEWQAKVFLGASNCRGLIPGHTFKLHDHHWFDNGSNDPDFLVISVHYNARNNYFDGDRRDVYTNTFTAVRRKIPYRPRRAHQAPKMPGPQTATVVGPKGSEIHTDRFGRIKVHFHWDRYGRHDERSSCWIRVSQPWAGQNWGTIAIPRVGQEVIIDYLEGDPDRPICTGRVYNAEQPVPYALPAAAHMMGFRSRSTPGGNGYCEMVIHDRAGQELINIHSQKDMVTTVQNNHTTLVHGAHQINTVSAGCHVTTVKKKIDMTSQTEHIHLTAQTDITLQVGASRIVMKSDGKITIEGVNVEILGSNRIDLNK